MRFRKNSQCFCILCFLFSIIVSGCSSQNFATRTNLDSWVGEYTYSRSIAPVVPGSPNLTESYTITVFFEDGSYCAIVDESGHMLYVQAKAVVEGNEDSIEVIFLEYLGVCMEPYKEGDIILELTRDGENIITKWVTAAPGFGSEKGAEGIYFVKTA